LSGRGLCDELITRPEESYRLCCVVVCDLETSRMGAPYIYDISRLRVKHLNSALEYFSIQRCPTAERALLFWTVPRPRLFVLLIRATCRWSWVCRIGSMILTEENRSTGIKTCPSATLSTTNVTQTDLGSNPDLRCVSRATDRPNRPTNLWILRLTLLLVKKIQSALRTKHTTVIKTSQLMLYREIIAVCSEIHTKHMNTLCGQNVELLNVKLEVHIVTTGL